MTSYITPPKNNSSPPSPILFNTVGAVDTWYFGNYSVDSYEFDTEVLGLTFTAKSTVAPNYNQSPIANIIGPEYLVGVRPPFAGTGQNTYSTLTHILSDTSFNLTNSDSFTFVYQTLHPTFVDHNIYCNILLDMCTKGFTKAGIWIEHYETIAYVYIIDDSAGLHITKFIYPMGFNPWKSGQFITWKWVFNKANSYGIVTTKIEGFSAVNQSANCLKIAGPDFSALDAVTFTGTTPNFCWFGNGASIAPSSGVVMDIYQVAFAKNITYDPGELP